MTPIFHGDLAALLILLVTFIFAVVLLAIIWRIALAMDRISQQLAEIARELKSRPLGKD